MNELSIHGGISYPVHFVATTSSASMQRAIVGARGVLVAPDSPRHRHLRSRRRFVLNTRAVLAVSDAKRKVNKHGADQSRGLASALLSALKIWESQDHEKADELAKRTVETAAEVSLGSAIFW